MTPCRTPSRTSRASSRTLWSWLNEDDTVGTRVFFWKQDDLAAGDTIDFSQRWQDEGDWELFGHINATVACTAAIFSRVSRDMRAFRDREVGGTRLQQWWSLAERNSPQLGYALRRDPQLVESTAALMRAVPELLASREAQLSPAHVGHARRILQQLREVGSRQARVDASRALDVLGHLQGRTVREAIELLSSVQPGRTPRPVKDIRHLLNPGLRIPRSVLQPIKPPQPGIRGPEATESG